MSRMPGHLRLHAVGQLVAGHPRGEVVAAGMRVEVLPVERAEQVEVLPLLLAGDSLGGQQVEDRRPLGPQRRPLVVRGQEPVAPVGRASLRVGDFGQHDEAGQVAVLAAQAVRHPRPERRVAAEAVAGVHLVHGRRVVDRIDLAAAIEAELVGNSGEVLPVLGHVGARLARLAEPERALDVVALAAGHRRLRLVVAGEFLEVQAGQLRLGVERVDVARAPFHHQEDARLGLRRQWRRPGCQRVGRLRVRLGPARACSASMAVSATLPMLAPRL